MDDDPYQQDRQRIDKLLARITNAENRDILADFLAEREAAGVRISSLSIYARYLMEFAVGLGPLSLRDATRRDFREFLCKRTSIEGNEIAPHTKQTRDLIIGLFSKWLKGTKDYPPEVAGLISKRLRLTKKPADHLITREMIQRIVLACPDIQSKALAMFSWDGGPRVSETVALNVGSIVLQEKHATATLPEGAPKLKTGTRIIRVIDAAPYLAAWLAVHPMRDDPKAPLFFRVRPVVRRATASSLNACLLRAGKRAGIPFRTHSHLYRHSAATEKGRLGWDDDMMRRHFGWSQDSNMPSHYRNNTDAELEAKILLASGLQPPTATAVGAAHCACPYCGMLNTGTNNYCGTCGRALKDTAAKNGAAHEAKRRRLMGMLSDLLADEEAKEGNPA